jgi:myogenesis-regulating glycosidase
VQVNLLMPALQFSIAPWDVSPETDQLCKDILALRSQVSGRLHALAEEAAQKLTPIARPMWWLDPSDPATFTINDQFALGDDVVVAPVVEKGVRSRDVYLPRGRWRDLFKPGEVITGPTLLNDYPAPLDTLPVFERVPEAFIRPAFEAGIAVLD